MKTSSHLWAFCFAFGLSSAGAGLTACGGKPAETAGTSTPGPDGSAAPGAAGSSDAQSATAGIVSGFGTPDERTDLTGGAKADYEKGFEAWSRGDLKTARERFQSAQSSASKSGAPGYALGIVQ
ncbi:MAG: hypothetical protein EOP08_14980, partial [Proteobacteria bacterium]